MLYLALEKVLTTLNAEMGTIFINFDGYKSGAFLFQTMRRLKSGRFQKVKFKVGEEIVDTVIKKADILYLREYHLFLLDH